jgi:thiol-disulfide isomerase/thioredoxin
MRAIASKGTRNCVQNIGLCAYRGRSPLPALLVLTALLGVACQSVGQPPPGPTSSTPSVPRPRKDDAAHIHALLINGGGSPPQNYQSHLLHVRELLAMLLQAGVRPDHISIFNADGSDPGADMAAREVQPEEDFWLLRGTHLERPLRTQITYTNSEVSGVRLEAATKANVTAWFEGQRARLRPGDTVLLYVTDHGTKDPEHKGNSHITLWGDKEFLTATELRSLVAQLDPGVRVVSLMSQCFSGGFADLMSARQTAGLPRGNACGYFSSSADRPAYGCYPENLGKDNIGYSFDFLLALRANPRFPDAQAAVLVADQTPDVPLTTGDVYLAEVLRRAAESAHTPLTVYIDALLEEAWRDKAAWETQIRLLDRIGEAFGMFSPRSLAELEEQTSRFPQIIEQIKNYSRAWKASLDSLAEANLKRFLVAHPDWRPRLDGRLSRLDPAQRRALTADLLKTLAPWSRDDAETWSRLVLLREKSEMAAAPTYRMEVRLAVVLRMRAILTDVAGQLYLATHATPAEREAYEALRRCEDLKLQTRTPPPGSTTIAERAPFPRFEEDLRTAEQALPAWMGIRFRSVTPAKRTALGLSEGATTVLTVYPDSPAQEAGVEPGDIVVGPAGAPFNEPNQIREWTMLSKIDEPTPLEVMRGTERLRLTLVPRSYPQKWPALPGPPKLASSAPPLTLTAFRGAPPTTLSDGSSHLLFFWATWCGPCKAAIPEVLSYETTTHTTVVAITDESAEQLKTFFQRFTAPFPQTVGVDTSRRSFVAYGVSGTPTFVLVDGRGIVRSYATGYAPAKGLGIDGWTWRDRPAANP